MILDLGHKFRFILFRFLTRLCWISVGDPCFWDRRQNLFHRCNSGHEQQQADGRRKILLILYSWFANVQVFLGAISALAVMTILSALLGFVVTTFIPREYTYYTCTAIMFLFGVKVWEGKCWYWTTQTLHSDAVGGVEDETQREWGDAERGGGGGGSQVNLWGGERKREKPREREGERKWKWARKRGRQNLYISYSQAWLLPQSVL